MKCLRKVICNFLVIVLCAAFLPACPVSASGFELGNTDLNILNGGVMLTAGTELYFENGGIFVRHADDEVEALSADSGKNLNLCCDTLYYTLGAAVKSVPVSGGKGKTVFTAESEISQMYTVNDGFYYISGGRAYARDGGNTALLTARDDILGMIPTAYGVIFLTGRPRCYDLYAGETRILSGVTSCYTDSGYLVVSIDGRDCQTPLSAAFKGTAALEDFSLHGTVALASLLDEDADAFVSEYNENTDLICDWSALLTEAGLKTSARFASGSEPLQGEEAVEVNTLSVELSEGQQNIVKRARQLTGFQWTPLENIVQWGNRGTFKAETTYTGIPYGQPVNTNGYIGYGISLDNFAAAILDNSSKLYTATSSYNKIAPYYSTDCSGFVSYCWGLSKRKTTATMPGIAEKVGDQSIYSLQVGDCLDKTSSHVVLVTGLSYDAEGNICWIEISEQTPVITEITRYGEGEKRSLASLQSYYLGGGYEIYRNPQRDSVAYTASEYVQLDGETATKTPAPKTKTTAFVGGKTVALSSSVPDAVIYYTTDGSTPTTSSAQFTGELTFTNTTKLYAIAVSPSYSGSVVLKYTVKVPAATTPTAALVSGTSEGSLISSGSTVKLSSVSGAKIYYTTDGSEPTSASSVYSSAIKLTADTTIKAVAQAAGYTQSATMTAVYKIGKTFTINATASSGGSISPAGNTSAFETTSKSYTITPSAGHTIKDVLVDGVSVGAVTSYTFSKIASAHTISASFTVSLPFRDVPVSEWYYDAVCFAYVNNLFKGMSETAFGPDNTMTRGMFLTVLGRYAGVSDNLTGTVGIVTGTGVNIRKGPSTDTEVAGFVSSKYTAVEVLGAEGDWYNIKHGSVTGYIRNDLLKPYSDCYTDLDKQMYYSPFIQWASLCGVADAGEVFRADENITREEMCVFMYNFAKAYGRTLPKAESKSVFSDDGSISETAKTAVYALQQADVINGMGGGIFSPGGSARRSEVAQIFKNYANALD